MGASQIIGPMQTDLSTNAKTTRRTAINRSPAILKIPIILQILIQTTSAKNLGCTLFYANLPSTTAVCSSYITLKGQIVVTMSWAHCAPLLAKKRIVELLWWHPSLLLPPGGHSHMARCLTNLIAIGFLITVVIVVIGISSQDSSEPLIVSRADIGDKWPFTVESGEIRCDRDRVTFHTEGKVYALNGTAMTFSPNAKDIFEISRVDPFFVRTPENPVLRLDESVRRKIVKMTAECRAGRVPDVEFEQCPEFINSKYEIQEEERERIISEGMILEWDPHRIPRIGTGDFIQRGLELCDK